MDEGHKIYDELGVLYEGRDAKRFHEYLAAPYLSPERMSLVKQAKLMAERDSNPHQTDEDRLVWTTSEEEEKRIRVDEREKVLTAVTECIRNKVRFPHNPHESLSYESDILMCIINDIKKEFSK
jgi:hypothetical protein